MPFCGRSPERFDPSHNAVGLADIFDALEKHQAHGQRDDIRGPHADPGRDAALLGGVVAVDKQEVVAADQHQRQDQARGAASAPGTHAERHAQQRKHQASGREGDAPLKLDARCARAARCRPATG